MTLDLSNTDKLNEFRLEAERLHIEVVPPDINRSGVHFYVEDGKIVYALAALKGLGAHAVEHLVQVRDGRPFGDLADFASRIDSQILGRKPLECLAQAGAFDPIDPNRARVFENIGRVLAAAQERAERTASGITDLFGEAGAPSPLFLADADSWPPSERLNREFAAVGTYLSAHPIDDYAALVKARGGLTWKDFLEQLRSNRQFTAQVAATVVQRQERRTRTGGRIGIMTFSDPTGQFEATVYQEKLADWRELLEPGQSVLVQIGGEFDPETEDLRVRIQNVEALEALAARKVTSLLVYLDALEPIDRLASRLDEGEGTVSVVVMLKEREVKVRLPGQYRVTPQVAGAIKAVPGIVHVEMQ
jgi:DNA polymerase-3 subunit alpha